MRKIRGMIGADTSTYGRSWEIPKYNDSSKQNTQKEKRTTTTQKNNNKK